MIYFTSNAKPCSQNESREKYKDVLSKEFRALSLYKSLVPVQDKDLYSNLIYLTRGEKKGCEKDVDNLSKPIIDAFKQLIYDDDKLIKQRRVTKIAMNDFDLSIFEVGSLPDEIAEKFVNFLTNNEEHILLFEVGSFNKEMIKVGIEICN